MAMDFSGKAGGRVIQNPMEAQSAEREEGLAWRVRMEGGADAGPDPFFNVKKLLMEHLSSTLVLFKVLHRTK